MERQLRKLYEKGTTLLLYAFLMLVMFICIYPFYYVFIYSISDPLKASSGIYFLPAGFNLDTYARILSRKDVIIAFLVSVARATIGSTVVVLCSSFFAFLVCQKKLPFRKSLYRLCIMSMYINAGLIPWYLLMKAYGLKDSFLLYIIPFAVGPFFVILVKTYIESLPEALVESAKIDGAGYVRVFLSVILPTSLPVIASVAVFSSVGHWNYWIDNFFLVNNPNLQTLQMKLYQYLMQADAIALAVRQGNVSALRVPIVTPQSVRMCTTIIVTLPVLCIYPFLQRYFASGILLGSVKG